MEPALDDVIVRNLNADVAIQTSSDDTRDEREDIADALPAIFGHALEGKRESVLALEGIHVCTVHHVGREYQQLGAAHALPEVPRTTHLGEYFRELDG